MSRVALIVEDFGEHSTKCAMLLSKLFSVPLSAIKLNFDEGVPVGERNLFDRKSPEFPEALVTAFEQLSDLGCRWRAFQLLDGDTWDPTTVYYEITPARLSNMIASSNEMMEEQRRTAELEGDTE